MSHDTSDDGYTDSSHKEEKEKKEKRPFWDRSGHKDKEKEKDRERARERDRERERERDRDRDRERDREREVLREREREKERKEEGTPVEITRMLGTSHCSPPIAHSRCDFLRVAGYLFATSSEDWMLVLDVCDKASANEENAKEAAKALRKEFKCVHVLLSPFVMLIGLPSGAESRPHSLQLQGFGRSCFVTVPFYS